MTTKQTPVILIVDDEPSNIEVLADIFDNHDILFATNGEKALEIATAAHPDLILLDVMMPTIDGYEVCRRLKADETTRDIPIIFITGLGDVGAEVKGLEVGAMDYVTKPFNPAVIKMRVKNQIELKYAREQLTRLAITDGLTGLANRRHFDDIIANEWKRALRTAQPLALMLMDVDLFKKYNDHYGHQAGDDCLRSVAAIFRDHARRSGDFVARYGGEEFTFIAPLTDSQTVLHIAENICLALADLAMEHTPSPFGVVTVSIGVASCIPQHKESHELLISKADEALYVAKAQGRNRAVLINV